MCLAQVVLGKSDSLVCIRSRNVSNGAPPGYSCTLAPLQLSTHPPPPHPLLSTTPTLLFSSSFPFSTSLFLGTVALLHICFPLSQNCQRVESENRKTGRMAQDELPAVVQNAPLSMFHQNQPFQLTVRDHQRLARDAVIGAVLDSSDRFEMKLSLELRQAQLNNESTMQHRDRDNFLRHSTEVQETTCGTSNVNSLKREKPKSINFFRHQLESEQRPSSRILESVPQERDHVRQEPQNCRYSYHRSKQAAHFTRAEV